MTVLREFIELADFNADIAVLLIIFTVVGGAHLSRSPSSPIHDVEIPCFKPRPKRNLHRRNAHWAKTETQQENTRQNGNVGRSLPRRYPYARLMERMHEQIAYMPPSQYIPDRTLSTEGCTALDTIYIKMAINIYPFL